MARKEFKPRRVTSDEERGQFSSGFIKLDEGEKFVGVPLFDGDPTKEEPGYYEFFEHWDTTIGRKGGSVPCAGEDDCPLCEDGDRPRNRAKSLWYVISDNSGSEINEVRTFDLNSKLIKQLAEMRAEGDKFKGVAYRVSLLDDRGTFALMPKASIKKLSAAEVKEMLKNAPDFDAILSNKIRQNMQRLMVSGALNDNDDDDAPAPKAAKGAAKGTAKGAAAAKGGAAKGKGGKAAAKEDWPEEGDELVVTVASVDEENFLMATSDDFDGEAKMWGTPKLDVTELDEGDEITASYATDDEGDKVLSAFEAAASDGNDGDAFDPDEASEFEGVLTIVSVDEDGNNIAQVATEDGIEFQMYGQPTANIVGSGAGAKVQVTAEKDSDGDWLATEVEEVEAAEEGGADGTSAEDLPDKIEDETFVVVSVDTSNQTMDVENDELGLKFTLWFLDKGPASKVDFDDYPEGTKIKVTAEKDMQDDMVATAIPEVVTAKGTKGAGAKGSAAKGAKGKGK